MHERYRERSCFQHVIPSILELKITFGPRGHANPGSYMIWHKASRRCFYVALSAGLTSIALDLLCKLSNPGLNVGISGDYASYANLFLFLEIEKKKL